MQSVYYVPRDYGFSLTVIMVIQVCVARKLLIVVLYSLQVLRSKEHKIILKMFTYIKSTNPELIISWIASEITEATDVLRASRICLFNKLCRLLFPFFFM